MVVTAIPAPIAGRGQVVIATEAIGVGGVDAVIRRGTLDGYGFTEGLIPGSEVAGRVTGVGDGVDPKWVGRRVWAFTGVGGGYVEHALASIDDVVQLPDGLSSIDAVTLGSAAPVAHFALAMPMLPAAPAQWPSRRRRPSAGTASETSVRRTSSTARAGTTGGVARARRSPTT
jgi:NADPH:quinone reductase-like Zn-dependent oxidoreductase